MSKWQVIKNPVGPGEYIYQVVRKKRESEPMHGGNMETAGVFDNEKEAVARKEELNRGGIGKENEPTVVGPRTDEKRLIRWL